MKFFGSITRLISVVFRKDSQDLTLRPNQSTTYTAARDMQLPPGDAAQVLVSADSTQTLTNKTLTTPTINGNTPVNGIIQAKTDGDGSGYVHTWKNASDVALGQLVNSGSEFKLQSGATKNLMLDTANILIYNATSYHLFQGGSVITTSVVPTKLEIGGISYATVGNQTTFADSLLWSWAWNGSNGYTIGGTARWRLTQNSTTDGDATLSLNVGGAYDPSTNILNVKFSTGNVGIGTSSPSSKLSVGPNSEFQVNSTGNITKINNVTTSFPGSQGAANTYLKNDGSGNLSWATNTWNTSIKTANYTAVANDEVFANSSGGSFTVTLPASPSAGWRVRVADYGGNWATNNVTVGRNSSNINGTAADFTLNVNDAWVEFIYVDSTQGWRVLT